MVQARQGSKRFKNKVLNKINNQELIKIQFSRLKKIKSKNKILYLIPKNNNDSLKKFLIENSIDFFSRRRKQCIIKILSGSQENAREKDYKTYRRLSFNRLQNS